MKITNVSQETCGVAGHGEDCLCDVIITTPTEIKVDAVKGMWMGELLCEHRGYVDQEWDAPLLADYFGDLLSLHDAWSDLGPDAFIPSSEGSADGRQYSRWMKIRRVVKRSLRVTPRPKIMDVLRSFGVTAEEFTGAVTTNKCVMDTGELERFEGLITDPHTTWAQVSGATGVSRHTVKTFYYYWFDQPPALQHSTNPNAPHRLRMLELIDKGYTNRQILDTIEQEFGVKLSSGAISHTRNRSKK